MKRSFSDVKSTRADISFVENNQYAVLRLKRSKTDLDHLGVQIMLAVRHLKRTIIKIKNFYSKKLFFSVPPVHFLSRLVLALISKHFGQMVDS